MGYILNIYFLFIDVEIMLILLDLVYVYVFLGFVCIVGLMILFYVFVVMFEDEEWVKYLVCFSFNE